jgi:CheY-like chemotaxis protein
MADPSNAHPPDDAGSSEGMDDILPFLQKTQKEEESRPTREEEPYESVREVREAVRLFSQRTTPDVQRHFILRRLKSSGALALSGVPPLMDTFAKLDATTRREVIATLIEMEKAGIDLGEVAADIGRHLNSPDPELREKVGELLITLGSRAGDAANLALGCTRHGMKEVRLLALRVLAAIGPSCRSLARNRLMLMVNQYQEDEEMLVELKRALASVDRVSTSASTRRRRKGTDAMRGSDVMPAHNGKDTREILSAFQNLEGARILLAEDGERMREVIGQLLGHVGAKVSQVGDGEEAIRMIQRKMAEGEGFDLILLDLIMPGKNGLEVLRQLRDDERTRGLRVVVMSAVKDREAIQACVQLGVESYLLKPLPMVKIIEAADSALVERKDEPDAGAGA